MNRKEKAVTRRQFLIGSLWAMAGLGLMGAAGKMVTKFLLPLTKTNYVDALAGELSEIPVGYSKSIRNLAGQSVVLINQSGTIRGFSASCTHLGCMVSWQKDRKVFHCPCHQGEFDPNGKAIAGPPKLPLTEFETKVVNQKIFVRMQQKTTGINL